MASCLGIYFDEDIIKYAKLAMDSSGNVRLDHYGTRIARGMKKEIIDNIIEETSSITIPIVTNIANEHLENVSIFDQAQESKYSLDIMKMEFETWCENNQNSTEKYDYVYKLSEYRTAENKHNGVLCIASKDEIEEDTKYDDVNIASVYSYRLLYTDMVPEEVNNYILINLDKEISVETVIKRKMFDFKIYKTGMNKILDAFMQRLGSYQKAYSACKQLNVYTEGESGNDKELEQIAEPILQEILRNISSVVTANKDNIERVYITGLGTMFNNIDVLLTEYLEVKTEILKPRFLQDTTDVRSVSEVLETTPAMVMAYNYLSNKYTFLNYLHNTEKVVKKNIFSDLMEKIKGVSFKKKNNEAKNAPNAENTKADTKKVNKVKNKNNENGNIDLGDVERDLTLERLVGAATFTGVAFAAYLAFTLIYTSTTNKMIDDVNTKITNLKAEDKKVVSDINFVNQNAKQYSEINEDVDKLVNQIETGQIGKISTYNVATFLQKIIKVIPKNITLDTVKSDDNKHVKITMFSNKYSDLGYFVAQLKLQGILNSVEVTNVENTSEKVTIEIGGELP